MSRAYRRHSRRILLASLLAFAWQLVLPHQTLASAASDAGVRTDVLFLLPTDQQLTPAIPLAEVVPTPKPAPKKPAPKVAKVRTIVMTAYSSTRDQTDGDPFTTASGQKVRDGIIAMNGVPFGTKVRIPEKFGDKVFVVQDRMSARYGSSRADIWMKTRHAAKQWGVKRVRVEILK